MAGVGLSEVGLSEAVRLGTRLSAEGLSAIYASPLQRALETAEPVARASGLEVIIDDDLNELDLGGWSGQAFDALEGDAAWARWNRVRQHSRPPGGESMVEAQARVARFLERTRDRHPHHSVAAVSHADVIKAALCWALGLSLDSCARFEVRPASINRVLIGDWGTKVMTLNEETAA